MALFIIPLVSACVLVLVLFWMFKLFERHFGKTDLKVEADIRKELEKTIWLLEDGTEAVFKDVVDGGRYFELVTVHGETVKVLAETLFRVGQQPMVKEIA
jgi:hypothetical protein